MPNGDPKKCFKQPVLERCPKLLREHLMFAIDQGIKRSVERSLERAF